MPHKMQLRQRLFRRRGALLTSGSPDEPPQPLRPSQPLADMLSSPHALINQSWNNTEMDEENAEGGVGGGGGRGGGPNCTPEQRDRLDKCQKSLEQLEFSLNNLLLNMSLAASAKKNQRRLEDADRFLTDLVDCIRANRCGQKRKPTAPTGKSQMAAPPSAAMRKRLEEESRALWRAQHIGARCEDTVDRYMLDVVVDRIGEMADKAGCSGFSTGKRSQKKRAAGRDDGAGGACRCKETANKHNSSAQSGLRDICFNKRIERSNAPRRRPVADARRRELDLDERPIDPPLTLSPLPPQSQPLQILSSEDQQQHPDQQSQQDRWTLRTWQPQGSNNNNCGRSAPPPATGSRSVSDLVASVAAYRRGSQRYEKALRVAAYLRDICREFYCNSCSGRAPPVAHALEATMAALTQLVAMRDRAVALAVRCTACPALCAAERVSNPQLCRLRGLLRLACTRGKCADASGGLLDLTDALATANRSADRCRILRRLRLIGTQAGKPDADYRRLINALANFTESGNCAANYTAHRKRMCGTAPPLAPGPRGVTAADMRALALDLEASEKEAASDAAMAARRRCSCGDTVADKQPRRQRCCRRPAAGALTSASAAGSSSLTKALYNPKEFRKRLRMHHFATGASLAVKVNDGFYEP